MRILFDAAGGRTDDKISPGYDVSSLPAGKRGAAGELSLFNQLPHLGKGSGNFSDTQIRLVIGVYQRHGNGESQDKIRMAAGSSR